MPFYCIRHPAPDVEKGICYGRTDLPLRPSVLGESYFDKPGTRKYPDSENLEKAYFERLITRENSIPESLEGLDRGDIPSSILTSPLQRCRIPAEELGEHLSIPVIIDKRLIEIDFGCWEMKRYDDLWGYDKTYRKWCEKWAIAETPGGDSFEMMRQRVKPLLEEYRGEPLVLYTHAGVIRAIMTLLEEISAEEAFARKVDYNEVIVFI